MNKLIKTLHLVFACLWLGTAASVVVLQCVRGWSADHRQLASLNIELAALDAGLIIPAAVGSLLTGAVMCATTTWRFIRFRWVIAKWIGTLCGILLGTVLLGPWQIQLVNLSGELNGPPVTGGPYALIRLPFTIVGFAQVYLLIALIAVSALKPWGKRIVHREAAQAISRSRPPEPVGAVGYSGTRPQERAIGGAGPVSSAQ